MLDMRPLMKYIIDLPHDCQMVVAQATPTSVSTDGILSDINKQSSDFKKRIRINITI